MENHLPDKSGMQNKIFKQKSKTMKHKLWILSLLATLLIMTGCEDDNVEGPSTEELTLNITGLEDLGSDYAYEGWIIVNGAPVSTGTFSVDANGTLYQTAFAIDAEILDAATQFVLSIEPVPDTDPAPADPKLLAGDFSGTSASLSTGLIGDFSSTTGSYILATPTTADDMDELSGVWFLNPNGGSPIAGLENLPTLPNGWVYEGWAVIDGQPVTTGTFTSASGTDNSAPFSGSGGSPAYPGEDFIMNAPGSLTFPTNLSDAPIVISIEPVPDNSAAPFTLKPLAGSVPTDPMSFTSYNLTNQASTNFPSGTVSR